MTKLYSKSTGGFYDKTIHGGSIPSDAVTITDEAYENILAAQSAGQIIQGDANGNPVAVARPIVTPTIERQIFSLENQQTARRYREAINGTDNGWMKDQDAQIAALRAQLPKGTT